MVSLQSQIERSGSEVEDQKTGCVKRRVLKKRFKIYIKTFGVLGNSLYFCNPKSREAGAKQKIWLIDLRGNKAYEKEVLNFSQKHLVNSKIVYTFALAIRNKRQKEFPENAKRKEIIDIQITTKKVRKN